MLRLDARQRGGLRLRLLCTATGREYRTWRGREADEILRRVFGDRSRPSFSSADKALVRRVLLAATAASLARDPGEDVLQPGGEDQAMDESRTRQRIRQAGIRCTAPRLAIARCLAETPEHLTAPRLIQRLRERGERCSRATVYNTLKCFAERGLVKAIVVAGEAVFYDPVTKPHPHLYRSDTGTLEDLDPGALPPLRNIELPAGLVARHIDLVIHAVPADREAATA